MKAPGRWLTLGVLLAAAAGGPVSAAGRQEMQDAVARVAAERGSRVSVRAVLQLKESAGAEAVVEEMVQQYFAPASDTSRRSTVLALAAALQPARALELATERIDGSLSASDQLACRLAAVALAGKVQVAGDGDISGADRPVAPVLGSGKGRIAFWRQNGDDWELVLAGKRLEQQRLVYRSQSAPVDGIVGRLMEWSPDGSMLAFCAASGAQRGSRIFVVKQDGGSLRCLTPLSRSESDAHWSPDGESLAVLQVSPSSPISRSIWSVRADGSEREKLVDDAAVPVGVPGMPVLRWSADGEKISWRAQPLVLELAAR